MGIFIGFIEKKGYEPTIYYNFKPIYEIHGNELVPLSLDDQIDLLPESAKHDINFSYNFNLEEQINFMKTKFSEKSLAVFEFVIDDLQDNVNARNERNQTGYKVITSDMVDSGKLRSLDVDGYYQIIKNNEILSDFYKDNVVEIDAVGLHLASLVLVELDDFYAGPYSVRYREIDKAFYICPQIKERKYIIFGHKKENCIQQELDSFDNYWGALDSKWFVSFPKNPSETEYIDAISDHALLENFKESIGNESIGGGKIAVADVETLLSHYESSALTGKEITMEIRRKRLNRLVEILTAESELDDTLCLISESLCDLLIKYKGSPNVDELIQNIVDKRPDFIDQIQGARIIKEQIAKLGQELDELQQQKTALDEEINEKRTTSQSVEQAAIEEKKNTLLEMDEQYTSMRTQLDAIIKDLNIADGVKTLSKKQAELQREVDYIQTHKSHLENDSKNIETEFLERINNPHDKMVGIAFDGFMANKMLRAAAQWEAEENQRSYTTSVKSVNAIEGADKEPEQLIQYLCDCVHIARPQYSKNTIINIAICLSQGFLTVFSGEPGCGKTSICNIFADVLGLNKLEALADETVSCKYKLKRYIPVSVERGWTSKRDFIGYFNPLSKTFDKCNQRIYDALNLLDIEKREDMLKYPLVILLDEANLSPMEYYWADFMNVCDELDNNSQINLGEDNVFSIPETLHFVATINNDHTTETLSPRLIDRAWVITLPHYATLSVGTKIATEIIEPVTWTAIKRAFLPESDAVPVMSSETQKIYDMNLLPHLRKARILVSPRTEIAIKRYWGIASKRLEKDEYGNDASIVALDYAIAQKILPKIIGNGDDFSKWLEELRNICSSYNLIISAKIIKEIIERGNEQMKYYQFF